MDVPDQTIKVPENCETAKVVKVKVKKRQAITPSTIVCTLEVPGHPKININGPGYGKVTMLCQEGSTLGPGQPLFKYEGCGHHVVMRDLCAECGANLRKEGGVCGERITAASASIPMVHMIPDLHVSESVAAEIALKDEESLLTARKLALLIDLDQTVLHTTTTPHAFRYKNVHRFNLAGCEMMYHTRFRPHLGKFLRRMVKRFQMHICTFGNRAYAHQLASILDPKRKYFCQRILSRDECFNPVTKALFPRGVHLVCIIDDRGDVWDWSPNLIQVQPYRFFPEVGDINGPPGRPLSMMPMPDFRAFNPPSPTGTSTSTDTSNSSDEEGPSSSNITKTGAFETGSKAVSGTIGQALGCQISLPKNVGEIVPPRSSPEPSEPMGESSVSVAQDASLKSMEPRKSKESLKCTNDEVGTKFLAESPKLVEEEGVKSKFVAENAPKKGKVEEMLDYPPLCESPPPPPLSPSQSIFEMSEEALDAFDSDYLLRLEEILTEIHRRYYRAYDKYMAQLKQCKANNIPVEEGSRFSGIPHVANVMSQMRARVLGPNTHITLSGLTPRNRPACDSLAGQIALGLGATLHNRLRLPKQPLAVRGRPTGHRAFTTHLVACRQNTEKVMAARNFQTQCVTCPSQPPPLYIVSPRWLWASHFRWQRLPESQFPLDHDYSVHAFDPDANSLTIFHGRSRYHNHHRRRHNQHRLSLHHHHSFMRDDAEVVMEVANLSEKQELSSSMVRSAIESIEQELRDQREHHRSHGEAQKGRKHKRTISESTGPSGTSATKRPCLRKSDGHLPPDEELDPLEGHSTSPSLSTTTDDDDVNYGDDKNEDGEERRITDVEMKLPPGPIDIEDNPDSVAIISDSDEEGLDSTIAEDDDDDEGDINTDEDEEDKGLDEQQSREVIERRDGQLKPSVPAMTESDLQEEMRQYLPPPCPLKYAENPLLHMSPQAASQMLDEVEEAVMEEKEERAASVPREMEDEVFSSSSSSNSSFHARRGKRAPEDDDEELEENDDEDEDDSQVEDRAAARRDLEQEERWLRIRQQLLLRRSGANRRALAKVKRRLWEISRSGSAGRRFSLELDRGCRGSLHQGSHRYHHRRNRHLSTDPSSRLSDELSDLREFNTCPEGYDYVDAERARELLRPETARQETRFDIHHRVVKGGEGSDDEEEEESERTKRKKSRKKKKKRVIGAAGYLEASLFGSDVSSSLSSPSSTNSDDRKGGGVEEDGIIRSDALKEFM